MVRPAGELWTLHDLVQPVRSLADCWHPDLIMEAFAETHDGSVQMIDTSIVRVHQHGGWAEGRNKADGPVERWATTKVHPITTECPLALN
jgi:hypothetical protein